ncbi:DUF47 domain-containing protein [Thermophilibacter sp.]
MPRIKKEDEFYTMLKEFAALIVEAAEEYHDIVCEFPESKSRIPHMKVYESTCDERVKAIMEKLYVSFITPIDREDISDLALAMDDVCDAMYGVAVRMDLFNLSDQRLEANQISELTVRAVREMQEMIDHLPNYKKDRVVMEKALAVGSIEDEGDTVYQTALRRLFSDEEKAGGKYAVTWLRIFDRMELCLDACDHVSGIVRDIIMKDA